MKLTGCLQFIYFIALSLIGSNIFAADIASPPIAIINPMSMEGKIIVSEIKNPTQHQIDGITFTSGDIDGKNVVQAYSGTGKVNAAVVTTLLIANYHPSVIILSGIAGGIGNNINIGDIIVGNKIYAVEHDETINAKTAELPQNIDPQTGKATMPVYTVDPDLLNKISNLNNTINNADNTDNIKIHIGTIATSDYFPDPTDVINSLTSTHANAIEMEGAAVMQVCSLLHTPCVVFRGVSDIVSNNNQAQPAQAVTAIKNSDPVQIAIQNVSNYTLAFINVLTA